jgi:hypothetical protein
VRVDVHFSIVQALRNRTVAGDWGLLLGRRSISGGQWVLEALEPMAAGSAVGPSPVFERWKQGPQKRISAVGYYRKNGDFSGAICNSDRLAVGQMFSQSALVLLVGEEGESARLFRIGAAAEGEPESVTIEDRRLSPDEPAVAHPDQQIRTEAAFANFQAANGATTPPQIAAERPTLAVPSAPRTRYRPGVVIAAAVVLGVGVIAMPHGTSPAVSTRSTSLLGLRAQKQGNDLKVFWNRKPL